MSVPLQSLVFGQKSVVGSIVGGRADMVELLDTAAVKGVRPILETFPISKVRSRRLERWTGPHYFTSAQPTQIVHQCARAKAAPSSTVQCHLHCCLTQ